MTVESLPRSAQDIADVIGREKTLYLIGQWPRTVSKGHAGGQVMLYVPKRLRGNHRLVRVLGHEDAQKLVAAYSGEILQLAQCTHVVREARNGAIRRLLRNGQSVPMVAAVFGVSHRTVLRIARPRQP